MKNYLSLEIKLTRILIATFFTFFSLILIYSCSTSIPISNNPTSIPSINPPITPTTVPSAKKVVRSFGSEQLRKELNYLIKHSYDETMALDIVYATNRKMLNNPSACNNNSFGVESNNSNNNNNNNNSSLAYGICRINVPKFHRVGNFEITDNPRDNSHQYFKVVKQNSLTESLFQLYLNQSQQQRPTDILIFVHGFNVKFEEAIIRTAQIAYDLKFQGPIVLFSWPAGAAEGMFESAMINKTYENNRNNVISSIPQFTHLLKLLSKLGITVHLMVHSMGHQIVIPALAQTVNNLESEEAAFITTNTITNTITNTTTNTITNTFPYTQNSRWNKKFIGELILNAPDIPVNDFEQYLPALKQITGRITVYCSYNDNAIAVSEIYNKNRRMGGCGKLEGVDSINVGEIDAPALGIAGLGHGLYSSRSILTDIFQLLLGIDANKRLFIRKSEPNSTEDYYLRP
ncbi:MAG: alpha/beta hydrolase [Oligoflexia bacterium]|nr:alpha/beta hydrolase [Oligoflexia bacterium]